MNLLKYINEFMGISFKKTQDNYYYCEGNKKLIELLYDENFDFEYVSCTIYIKCFDLDYYSTD
jgi:hypothetical protein